MIFVHTCNFVRKEHILFCLKTNNVHVYKHFKSLKGVSLFRGGEGYQFFKEGS